MHNNDAIEAMFLQQRPNLVSLSKRAPHQLVDKLATRDAHRAVQYAIKRSSEAVIPALVAAIGNPAFRKPFSSLGVDPRSLLPPSATPLQIVLSCLEHFKDPNTVAAISPLVDDNDNETRKEAALTLASIAADSCIAPLKKALADDDPFVRSSAIIGMRRALKENRASAASRDGLFDAVKSHAATAEWHHAEDAVRCLMELNRQLACQTLADPAFINESSAACRYALKHLRKVNALPSEAVLLDLLERIKDRCDEGRMADLFAELLRALSSIGYNESSKLIEQGLASPIKEVRSGAADAIAILSGVSDACDVAYEQLTKHKWKKLPASIQNYLAVHILAGEVANGGIHQYFTNSSGDDWEYAIRGLKAIGAQNDAAVVQVAIDVFGPKGPSTKQPKREKQYNAILEQMDDPWESVSDRFLQDLDDRNVLLAKYAAANSEDFGKSD